jgi:group I intron endonuclease
METKKYYVYKHTNKTNGKVYIGITCLSPKKRWKNGKGYSDNKHFTNAINKYGWDGFDHLVLVRGLTEEEAKWLEIQLITVHNSTNREKGYNISPGGDTVSEETRQKISAANKGENNFMYGKHHTEETRKKIGESQKGERSHMFGKHLSEKTKQKMSTANKGENNPMYGKTDYNNPNSKTVVCVTTGYCFGSTSKAGEYYGIHCSNIATCCRGKQKSAGKLPDGTPLRWKYVKDLPKPKLTEGQKQHLREAIKLFKSA